MELNWRIGKYYIFSTVFGIIINKRRDYVYHGEEGFSWEFQRVFFYPKWIIERNRERCEE
jgi:hypothetical protein